jgi:choline dehydrogenase-like flavoprotein
MPNITGGNTSAPAMMIGERAAEFIIQDSRSDTVNSSPKLRSVAGGAYA